VLAILREIALPGDPTVEPQSLAQIRAAIEALPIAPDADATRATDAASRQSYSAQIGQQQVKEAVLQDIDDHARTHASGVRAAAGPWAEQARPTYAAWLRRAENR
jgi:hypothetical protein